MKNYKLFIFLSISYFFVACSGGAIKEKINQTGDAVGQAAGELTKGVVTGVDKSSDARVELSADLTAKGVQLGKVLVNDSTGRDNLLTIYTVFNSDFSGTITAKIYDVKNLEIGRTSVKVAAQKNEAKYLEFLFDKRTNIDFGGKIIVE